MGNEVNGDVRIVRNIRQQSFSDKTERLGDLCWVSAKEDKLSSSGLSYHRPIRTKQLFHKPRVQEQEQ